MVHPKFVHPEGKCIQLEEDMKKEGERQGLVWNEHTRTHYMMYDTCGEGTPMSPPFPTMEDLAAYLAETKASWFGYQTASEEQWLGRIQYLVEQNRRIARWDAEEKIILCHVRKLLQSRIRRVAKRELMVIVDHVLPRVPGDRLLVLNDFRRTLRTIGAPYVGQRWRDQILHALSVGLHAASHIDLQTIQRRASQNNSTGFTFKSNMVPTDDISEKLSALNINYMICPDRTIRVNREDVERVRNALRDIRPLPPIEITILK